MKKVGFILMFALLPFALAACDKPASVKTPSNHHNQQDVTTAPQNIANKKQASTEALTKQTQAKQAAVTTQNQAQTKKQLSNLPKNLPKNFPKDVVLPADLQINQPQQQTLSKDNMLSVKGLMRGRIENRTKEINQLMLRQGWKASLVMPQKRNALMQYFKPLASNKQTATVDKRQVVIELIQSDGGIIEVDISYTAYDKADDK